jgi:hypothetical protein
VAAAAPDASRTAQDDRAISRKFKARIRELSALCAAF